MSDAPRAGAIEVRIDTLELPAGTPAEAARLEAAIARALARHAAGDRGARVADGPADAIADRLWSELARRGRAEEAP